MMLSRSVYTGARKPNRIPWPVRRCSSSDSLCAGYSTLVDSLLVRAPITTSPTLKREFLTCKGQRTHNFSTGTPVLPLPHETVEEKLPADYVPNTRTHQERDPTRTDGDSNQLLVTSQPSVPLESTFADYPDRWTECLVTPAVKKQILSAEGFPQAVPRPILINGQKPYTIQEIPGRGLGIVATRDLKTGDLVISERPMMVVSRAIRVQVPTQPGLSETQKRLAMMAEWETLLQTVFNRLQPEHKEAFMKLHDSHQNDGSGKIMGIIRTNGFGIEGLLDEEYGKEHGRYTGAFEDSSRLNHSCGPNTLYSWDPASFSMQFHAARDIKAGEEVTTHYNDLQSSTEERQRSLLPYGFQCTCSSCSTVGIDTKRAKAAEAKFIDNNEFAEWFRDVSQPDDKYMTRGLAELALLRELELDIWMDGPLYRITQSYVVMGDAEGAMRYGPLLKAVNRARHGQKFQDSQYTLEYFESLPTWGLRAAYKATNTPIPPPAPIPWEIDSAVGAVFFGDDPAEMVRGLLQSLIDSEGEAGAMAYIDSLEEDGSTKKELKEMLQSMISR